MGRKRLAYLEHEFWAIRDGVGWIPPKASSCGPNLFTTKPGAEARLRTFVSARRPRWSLRVVRVLVSELPSR